MLISWSFCVAQHLWLPLDAPDATLTTDPDGPGADAMDTSSSSALRLPEFPMRAETLEDGMTELADEPIYDEGTDGGNKLDDGLVDDGGETA